MQDLNSILAISPIDGRYYSKTKNLSEYFSEFALIRYRIVVEVEWLKFLANNINILDVPSLTEREINFLDEIVNNFSINDAQLIKKIEKDIRHDVKAIEYFLQKKISIDDSLVKLSPFIHFACTSEDINNLAYALMIKDARDKVIIPKIKDILATLKDFSGKHKNLAMLARTHGQDASPTTIGKEFYYFYSRLSRSLSCLEKINLYGKFNGATGNYNAHYHAYSNVDWLLESKKFVTSFNIEYNSCTTQIEPHDYIADFLSQLANINSILIDFSRDVWAYISIDYLKQKTIAGEIGSSTMPHKVNPIMFENAEGNLGVANSLLRHLAEKLPISRWQRDLSDSTVLRNLGVSISYSYLSYMSLLEGLEKIEVNKEKINDDLEDKWHLLAEPVQISMKKYGITNAYEQLKSLTRGKYINKEVLEKFIYSLKIPDSEKKKLLNLTPAKYIGLADKIVEI